ncbi:MAG: biotin--[Clostridia bacterium]|nr:biotin--[acetyl-CoA-carboxylase] ligase [Clostridia bacterium]
MKIDFEKCARLEIALGGKYEKILVFDEIGSTNDYLKQNAGILPDRVLVAAVRQTGGRGRRGHVFSSPAGGAYFSILIKNCSSPEKAKNLTVLASVAAAEGIEILSGVSPGIKWVNDLFYKGKKIAGILCEAVSDGTALHLICGVGINVLRPAEDYPPEISGIAGAISDYAAPPDICELISNIAARIGEPPEDLNEGGIIDRYRKRSIVIGKNITVSGPAGERSAKAIGIRDDASLLVEYPSGVRESLDHGEISIKL